MRDCALFAEAVEEAVGVEGVDRLQAAVSAILYLTKRYALTPPYTHIKEAAGVEEAWSGAR